MEEISKVKQALLTEIASSNEPRSVLKSNLLKDLYKKISKVPADKKAEFGKSVNTLRKELEEKIEERELAADQEEITAIDITAPLGVNEGQVPNLKTANEGTIHPLSREIERIVEIYNKMGFLAVESRQLDDDYNMFEALNFPAGHPARDSYDTFRTAEGFIPPAHTSTMQNRILRKYKSNLEAGGQIAAVSYGRCFRNEDLDATHEHTFYQCEGVFVSENATLGQMIGVLTNFFENYYEQKLNIKTQPAYFPFVEPGLEFAIEKPAALGGKKGEFLEMLGCGMIHPNVLKKADIDPEKYKGFAWGGGVDRLVMLKYGIDDLRYFESAKLQFLKEF